MRKVVVTQAELTRNLKAHRDAGVPIYRTETRPDGTVIVFSSPEAKVVETNPWDRA